MRHLSIPALLIAGALSACAPTYDVGAPGTVAMRPAVVPGDPRTEADFARISARIEPVAEGFCRESAGDVPPGFCDFSLVLDEDPKMPPNAYQTRTESGRPVVVVSRSLLAQMLSDDEIAFVLGHEAGHHIADHISKGQSQAMTGALVMGTLATLGNASDQMVQDMMRIGASLGGRVYSQSYELEADTLGAYVAARAGYDPERGARIFARPDMTGGGGMLSSHPASGQRQATIAATSAEIRRQQARGQTPTPVPMRTSLLP